MVKNIVRTSKYNIVTFIPLNLLSQFKKMANVYFLLISFLQTIKSISISDGKSVMAVPLVFVLLVSMVKDAFEDYKRHKSDAQENEKSVMVLNRGTGEFEFK
jgi:phospholipid-transporting ATPase